MACLNIMVDLCGVCSLRVKANLVLCIQCGKWIHGRCVGVKKDDCIVLKERWKGNGAGKEVML